MAQGVFGLGSRCLIHRCPLLRAGAVLAVVSVVFGMAPPSWAQSERRAAIVADAVTGEVLYELKADRRHYPASLTKMMTLYLLFDALQHGQVALTTSLPVSKHASDQPPSKVGVAPGDWITVEQAIRSLAVKSGNDVAVVVAEALAGSEAAFARQMTAMARRLGMWRTSFFNASGLPDERQLSTPRDMAKLSRALLYDFPQYYHYFSAPNFSYKGRRFSSHNRLLYSYSGTDGIKTGYTRVAGYNISVSAVRSGRRLVAVVFGANSSAKRNTWAASLLDRAYPYAATGHPREEFRQAFADGGLPTLQPKIADSGLPQTVVPTLLAVANKPPSAVQTGAGQSGAVQGSLSGSPNGDWAIQVGAFAQPTSAKDAAKAAIQTTKSLGGGTVRVVQIASGGNRLFRSRVAGLGEVQARAACDFRSLHGAPCLVIAPGR